MKLQRLTNRKMHLQGKIVLKEKQVKQVTEKEI